MPLLFDVDNLRKGTRQSRGYNGMPIGNRMRSIEWRHLQWS